MDSIVSCDSIYEPSFVRRTFEQFSKALDVSKNTYFILIPTVLLFYSNNNEAYNLINRS